MLDIKEYKKISLDFRRVASNFLRTEYTNQDIPLRRFYNYIEKEEIIRNIISEKIDKVSYDFHECFGKDEFGRSYINIPLDEEKHIKAMYDYLMYIVKYNISLYNLALEFPCGSKKITDYLQNFIDLAFKPLIDYIQDELSKIMIMVEEENMEINMSNNQGVINYAKNGSNIKSDNVINQNDLAEISRLIAAIKEDLKLVELSKDEKESIIDDVELVQEQLQCSIEKPTRLKKAFNNIKLFLTNSALLTGAGITLANNINQLVTILQPFIDKIM